MMEGKCNQFVEAQVEAQIEAHGLLINRDAVLVETMLFPMLWKQSKKSTAEKNPHRVNFSFRDGWL